jgi:hypothetical protein
VTRLLGPALLAAAVAGASGGGAPGILLEDLTWVEAEKVLTPDGLVEAIVR